MPVYYYTNSTASGWYTPTSATTATNSNWITLATNGTATTAITSSTINRAIYWYVADDWSNDNTWVTMQARPVMTRPVPERFYIARRSRAQAAEDELRYYYEQEQRRQQNNIRRQHNQAAHDRSRELLLAHLTPAQRETFAKNKWFIVEGGLSKQRYRIRDTGHMVANIDVLGYGLADQAPVVHRLCGHCDINEVPLYDQLLAQKMMLELDEERFLKVANRHRVVA